MLCVKKLKYYPKTKMLKIIKAETSLGSSNGGTELAPDEILKLGLLDALTFNNIAYQLLPLEILGPISVAPNTKVKNHETLTVLNRSIYETAIKTNSAKDITLLLGGDHSTSIGSMFATKKLEPNAAILYIDAHPDSNTPDSSPSGNMHGMSLSTVLGDSLYTDYGFTKYKYNEAIILGAKDIDQYEQNYIKEKSIKMFTVSNVTESGIGEIMTQVLDHIKGRPLHISLDIDSIDVSEAPGTGIINKGGLSYREIKYITEKLSSANICSIDIMEINPQKDVDNKTINLGIELILNLLGHRWTPYEKYLSEKKSTPNY